jgi:hypothetical protein
LTFSGASSTINFTGNSGATLQPGGRTFGFVKFIGGGTASINSNATYSTLEVNGHNVLQIFVNQTVTSQLTLVGTSANRLTVRSNTLNLTRTITKTGATVTAEYVDFRNITLSTGTTDLSAITGGSGDLGGNSGITFSTAQDNYWVGDTGNWSDASKWANSSGGTGGTGRASLAQDTAFFDANSFSAGSQTITADIASVGNLDFTGATNTQTFALSSMSVSFYGSITLISAMNFTQAATMTFLNRLSKTLDMGGKTNQAAVVFNMIGGTMTLNGALTTVVSASGGVTLTEGTLNLNGYTLSVGAELNLGASATRTFKYNIYNEVAKTLTVIYNIYNLISKSQTFIYNLYKEVTKSNSFIYHLFNKLGLWNSRTKLSDDGDWTPRTKTK